MKKKSIYWLCRQMTSQYKERKSLLSQKGVQVQFFNDIGSLLEYYTSKRVNVIVVSDDLGPNAAAAALETLSSHPNLYGVRVIFSVSKNIPFLIEKAYEMGVRDIIPLDLEPKPWCQRFLFSSGAGEAKAPEPLPQLLVKSISGVYVPGRVVWLDDGRIRIECRIQAKVGTRLTMIGPIARFLGVKTIAIVIEKKDRSNLRYRYSDAFICRLKLPKDKIPKLGKLLALLEEEKSDKGLKIFSAVKTADVRNELIEALGNNDVILATALNRQHITTEPKYFSPQLVFIEDLLCLPSDLSTFHKMVENLPEGVPIVVIGDKAKVDSLRSLAGGRKIHVLPKVRENMMALIYQRYLTGQSWQKNFDSKNAIVVGSKSRFTCCEIYVPARLRAIHPQGATLALPVSIGRFGFCRVESSFIKKTFSDKVFGKIVASYNMTHLSSEHPHMVDVLFGNILLEHRKNLSALMAAALLKLLGIKQDPRTTLPKPEKIPDAPIPEKVLDPEIYNPEPLLSSDEVIEKIAGQTKQLARNVKNSEAAKNFVPLFLVLAFLGLMGATLYWMMLNYDPKESVSGSTFTRELEKFKNQNR